MDECDEVELNFHTISLFVPPSNGTDNDVQTAATQEDDVNESIQSLGNLLQTKKNDDDESTRMGREHFWWWKFIDFFLIFTRSSFFVSIRQSVWEGRKNHQFLEKSHTLSICPNNFDIVAL